MYLLRLENIYNFFAILIGYQLKRCLLNLTLSPEFDCEISKIMLYSLDVCPRKTSWI